jgi:hypothetical protein
LTEARARRAGRARALRALPCLLLVAVAAYQIALSRTSGLSPWSGGGFGMFSTTDAAPTRHLHTFAIQPGLRREIPQRRLPEDIVERAIALPTVRNLERVAEAARAIRTNDHAPASALEVQVWHTRYDPEDRRPASRMLRGLTVPVGTD